MADLGEQVGDAGENVKEGLSKKLGPLPVWGWVLVLTGGGLATYWLFFRGSPSTAGQIIPSTGVDTGATGGGTGGGTGGAGGGTGGASAAAQPTNLEWLSKAVDGVAKATGIDPARVRLYLEEYLSGRAPIGAPSAVNDFERVVQNAVSQFGQPPNQPGFPNPNQNPFESNMSWLSQGLSFVSGVTPAIRQEIIALLNGTTTSISPEAAAVLDNIRNIIGAEPTPFLFTIAPPGTPPTKPGPNPQVPASYDITDEAISALNGWFQTFMEKNGVPAFNNPLFVANTQRILRVPQDIAIAINRFGADYYKRVGEPASPEIQAAAYNAIANHQPLPNWIPGFGGQTYGTGRQAQ